MTPLAQRTLRLRMQGVLPWDDADPLLDPNCRCFEMTGVRPLVEHLTKNDAWALGDPEAGALIPAPVTWFEFGKEDGGRVGYLVQPRLDWGFLVSHIWQRHDEALPNTYGTYQVGPIKQVEPREPARPGYKFRPIYVTPCDGATDRTPNVEAMTQSATYAVMAACAVLATPRLTQSVDHEPHAGLSREARRLRGATNMNPWREIKLSVTDTRHPAGEGGASLTGEKALHFCRSHLRVRRGRLEYVRPHWRGNPEKGVVNSYYTVTA